MLTGKGKMYNNKFDENEHEKRVRGLRSKIEILYELKKHDLLIKEAQKLLSIEPNDGYALFMMGLSYVSLKRFEDAEKIALSYLELEPNNQLSHFLYGKVLSYTGNYEKAVQEYEKAIELDLTDSFFYLHLAATYYVIDKINNLDKSKKLILKALELDPDNPVLHTFLSQLHINEGRLADAEKESLIALELEPGKSFSHEQFARVQTNLGNIEKSQEHLLESLRLDPNNEIAHQILEFNDSLIQDKAEYYSMLIRNNINTGNIDEAESLALKYVQECPNDGHAHFCLGFILYSYKKNIPQAIDSLRKAISLGNSPNSLASAYYTLASCIFENDKNAILESIELLKKALEISPDKVHIRTYLVDLYLSCANYGAAEKECLKLMQVDGKQPLILALWAKVQFYSANFSKAKEYIDKTLEIEPNNPIALRMLNEIDGYQKKPKHFLNRLIRSYYYCIRNFPENEKGYLVIARAYLLMGAIRNSIISIKKYLELKSNDNNEFSIYLQQLCDLDQKDKVLELLIKLHNLYPNNRVIEQTIEALYKEGVTYKRKLFGIF